MRGPSTKSESRPLDDERVARLERAASQWKRQLVDTTRGPLLRYRDLKRGTLDLTPAVGATGVGDEGPIPKANGKALDALLRGRTVSLSHLFPSEEDLGDARRRMSTISRAARIYLEEKGIDSLFLAAGLTTWQVKTGARPNAPAILLPITVEPEGIAHRDFKLTLSGDAKLNPVLVQTLETEFGIQTPEDQVDLENPATSYTELRKLITVLARHWEGVPALDTNQRLVVGNFRYANMPMVRDLETNLDAFAASDLVAAVAGDSKALASLQASGADVPIGRPDVDPPESEFLILDSDSSQHHAINRCLAGQHLVIWGPPGTGKSQTIANLIAALMAQSKKVLFVAQKRAAIDVVVSRLQRVGLDDWVMDAHGGIKTMRDFAQDLSSSIQRIKSIPEQNYSGLHKRLASSRDVLVAHDATMHELRQPWGISTYDVQSRLLAAPEAALLAQRLPRATARRLNRRAIQKLQSAVNEWTDLDGHNFADRVPEWAASAISTGEDLHRALDVIDDVLLNDRLRSTSSLLSESLQAVGLSLPDNFAQWPAMIDLLSEVRDTLAHFHPRVYNLDHEALTQELTPPKGVFAGIASAFSRRRRRSRHTAREALRSPLVVLSDAEIVKVLNAAASQKWRWRQLRAAGNPRCPEDLDKLQSVTGSLRVSLSDLEKAFPNLNPTQRSAGDLMEMLELLESQRSLAARLPRLRELEGEFKNDGVERVIAQVGRQISTEQAPDAVEYAWLQAVWDDMQVEDRRLAGFTGDVQNRVVTEFASHYRQHLQVAPERISRIVAEQAIATMNEHQDETTLINREAAKKRRHLTVRRLLGRVPNVLTALKPCWTMSPLQVAELVPPDAKLFDVVIFDEASQIPPAEAIGSLVRAPQAIIAGDDRQLPPTSFFTSQDYDLDEDDDGDDDGASLTVDLESILDVAKAVSIHQKMLQWHYRSRDSRLIGFSNVHIYQSSLTAFPGTAQESPIVFHPLDLPPQISSSTVSHPGEVEKVINLVLEHARDYPKQSLGVIAFGSKHADNLENALRTRLRDVNDSQLSRFFSETADEPFFIKNIERVQGDERDVIILSVGYHKAANGSLPYRFGPLNQDGGERRLNVAITRARSRMHLVCAFTHHDMDPGRSTARGVELLRQYLEFADSGGVALGGDVSDVPLNPFELDILHRLQDKGIPVTPQYGVGGYRLDFACAHPEQVGRMVMAIEADGASYHSTPIAKERDYLRQEVLENLGWRFHRIWSTDWFRNASAETDRAFAAWKDAMASADRDAAAKPEPPPPAPPASQPKVPIRRGSKPTIRPGESITKYERYVLVSLAKWILSDTLLRTDEELMREMRQELGFGRDGKRIRAALQEAIKYARPSPK